VLQYWSSPKGDGGWLRDSKFEIQLPELKELPEWCGAIKARDGGDFLRGLRGRSFAIFAANAFDREVRKENSAKFAKKNRRAPTARVGPPI